MISSSFLMHRIQDSLQSVQGPDGSLKDAAQPVLNGSFPVKHVNKQTPADLKFGGRAAH